MSLARAELRRLCKRRFTRWMLVFVVLILGATVAGIAASNHAPDSAAVAAAEERAQRQYEENLRAIEHDIAECERARAAGEEDAAGGRAWPDDCDEMRQWAAGPDEMARWHLPPTFEFRADFEPLITAFTAILALFAFIVGASFIGAEWRSGGMTNLLLWQPRRLLVLSTKLATLVAALAGLVVLLGAAWTAAFWQVATYRGITDTMTSGTWQSLGLTGLRGTALVLAAGAVGFAVSSLGRHTATALGAAIGAFIVGVLGAQIVAFAVDARYPQAWVWTSYLQAWMHKSVTFHDFRSCEPTAGLGPCEPATMEVTWQAAGVGILAVVALLVGAAMWHIHRRDVT